MPKHRRKIGLCPNCETILKADDNFCPNCGQENHDLKVPIGHLIYETIENITHFDTKLWNTLKAVFSKPGKITTDFLEGKRARHVHPIRLYIFVSFLYFILVTKLFDTSIEKSEFETENTVKLSQLISAQDFKKFNISALTDMDILLPQDTLQNRYFFDTLARSKDSIIDSVLTENGRKTTANNREKIRTAFKIISQKEHINIPYSLNYGFMIFNFKSNTEKENFRNGIKNLKDNSIDSLLISQNMDVNWLNRNLFKRLSTFDMNSKEQVKNTSHAIIKSFSNTMFIMMPLVAVLLLLVMDRKKYFYEHLIFSVHIHTVYFFFYSMLIGFSFLFKSIESGWILGIIIPFSGLYLLLSLKHVYKKTWVSTFFRVIYMFIPYFLMSATLFTLAIFKGFFNI
jgi:Protein of unknown function (DUF3667)